MLTVIGPNQNSYRSNLYRTVDANKPYTGNYVVYIMLNPSTAKTYEEDRATDNDATIRKLIVITQNNGFENFSVVNLFSYIATDKNDLLKVDDPIGPDNDRTILKECEDAAKIVVAWGGYFDAMTKNRADFVLSMLQGKTLYCLAINKNGSPTHPLYLSSKTEYKPFSY